jgi:hypothetical protein
MLKVQVKDKSEANEIDKYDAETQRIRALSDHEVDANQMEMDAIKAILDGSKTLDDHDLRREEGERQERLHNSTLAAQKEQARSKAKSQSGSSNG